MLPLSVRTTVCADGERLPTLVDRSTGLPDFDATLWVVSSLRGRNWASHTIAQALRSVAVLNVVLRSRGVDVGARLREGRFLDPDDLEAITKGSGAISESIEQVATRDISNDEIRTRRVVSLEALRMAQKPRAKTSEVKAGTMAIRLFYIRDFLKWRVDQELLRLKPTPKASLAALRDLADDYLETKTPSVTGNATLGTRMGIDGQTLSRLLDVVRPGHPENPWKGEFLQVRNQLIVNAFVAQGPRRGELLGVRITDLKPDELLILRRPDDKADPRNPEPNTKTRDRLLPVSADLYRIVKSYIMLRHTIVRRTRSATPFLLISIAGTPLSISETNRIFRALDRVSGLAGITPHVLRHTFFENLADDLHRAGESDDYILAMLRRLGGWSDHSNSPRRYTKRFAQERAEQAALSLQKKLYIKAKPQSYEE